jgi:hypothetical protein
VGQPGVEVRIIWHGTTLLQGKSDWLHMIARRDELAGLADPEGWCTPAAFGFHPPGQGPPILAMQIRAIEVDELPAAPDSPAALFGRDDVPLSPEKDCWDHSRCVAGFPCRAVPRAGAEAPPAADDGGGESPAAAGATPDGAPLAQPERNAYARLIAVLRSGRSKGP